MSVEISNALITETISFTLVFPTGEEPLFFTLYVADTLKNSPNLSIGIST